MRMWFHRSCFLQGQNPKRSNAKGEESDGIRRGHWGNGVIYGCERIDYDHHGTRRERKRRAGRFEQIASHFECSCWKI